MTHTILVLLKMGSQKNMTDLLKNGTLYLNPIEYFRTIEDGELRGDSYEGGSEIINAEGGNFSIPGIEREFSFVSLHALIKEKMIIGNIFSMYAVSSFSTPNPLDFTFDSRNCSFGTHCVMIKNLAVFFDKIKAAMKKLNLKYTSNFVQYYNKDTSNKKLTIFDKPLAYSYQNEFRFYVRNETLEPIVITLGSLERIAEMFETTFMNHMKLMPKIS